MRMISAGIEDSGVLHKLYMEYSKDVKQEVPHPRFWIHKFANPSFFCILFKHGKKPVGFVMGEMQEYYQDDKSKAHVQAVFIRRGFRGKFKFIRKAVSGVKKFFSDFNVNFVLCSKVKPRERAI